MRIVLFIKKDKPATGEVIEYLSKRSDDFIFYAGAREDGFPEEAVISFQDILISYLSPWVIPEGTLKNTRLWNINFHPGPPEYPGIGCFNFAIYNGEKSYGVTAHLMDKSVDSGKIIAVKRFPLLPSDSVHSLSVKSYECMLSLFREVMDLVLAKGEIPDCGEKWQRKAYRREDLEDLCRIDPGMGKEEIEKRIKATTYPDMPGAYMDIVGYRFAYAPDR